MLLPVGRADIIREHEKIVYNTENDHTLRSRDNIILLLLLLLLLTTAVNRGARQRTY
jgi:hypothetical protein